MSSIRKDKIRALLKGIETGDPASVEVVDQDKYIQHNPQTHDGSEGFAALFKRLAKSSPRVNLVRVFSDGDFVFAHTEYDFATRRIGFEVFRFEGDRAVEHWDNLQPRHEPTPSGHTMVDGPTEVLDLELTEANRAAVRSYIEDVLICGQFDNMDKYIATGSYTQHSPHIADGLPAHRLALATTTTNGLRMKFDRSHRILAEGNFVLSVCEGSLDGVHTSFYDLYRLADGKIVEHWDTVEMVAPRSEWKNDNGKF
jgi:predicted SnoaL-like aldol condensation-catalyzing enzyme